MALTIEHQSARMSKIKNTEPFKQQQFGTAGTEGVNYQSEFIKFSCDNTRCRQSENSDTKCREVKKKKRKKEAQQQNIIPSN